MFFTFFNIWKNIYHNVQVLVPGQSLLSERGYCGVFRFRFWQYGDWVEVVIDDQLPCTRDGRLAFIHSDSDTEFWSPLLEKAFAKLHGGYASLRGGSTCEALVDFTGGISEVVNLNKPGMTGAELFRLLLTADNKKSLNCCSIQPDPNIHEARTALGLVKGHAYSITKVNIFLKDRFFSLFRIIHHNLPGGAGQASGGGRGEAGEGEESLGRRREVARGLGRRGGGVGGPRGGGGGEAGPTL